MNLKQALAITFLLAGAACASHASAPAPSSGKVVIVQMDKAPSSVSQLDAFAQKMKVAGAKVVVIDMVGLRDPTTAAIEAVQEYTGKMVEANSLTLDDKTKQLKPDVTPDKLGQGAASFAQTMAYADASKESLDKLKADVSNKIVYIGCAPCGAHLYADAQLADQVLRLALAPKSDG